MGYYRDAVLRARVDCNDAAVPYRIDDATMLQFIKDGITEMAPFRPDLFKVEGVITCIAGQLIQTIPNAPRAVAIMDVYSSEIAGVKQGMERCEVAALRRFQRTWRTDAAAQAENWMPYPQHAGKHDARKFMIYPKAPAGQTLDASWAEVPDMSAVTTTTWASDVLPITDELVPALGQYAAYRSENLNEEASVKARADGYYASFLNMLGASAAQKEP